jgi:hypothetical protein
MLLDPGFTGCSQLENVKLPKQLVKINSNTFNNLVRLQNINIPMGI